MQHQNIGTVKDAVKHWYLSLILGIFFIFAGFWVLQTPVESYLALSILFSLTFFVNGIAEIFYYTTNRQTVSNWGWGLTGGIIDLLFGLWLIASPLLSAAVLPFVVGFMLLFRSSTAMAVSFDMKSHGTHEWWLLLIIGILGLIFSFMILFNPVFGGMTIVIWTALALLSIGLFRIMLAFKLKRLNDRLKT
ncbi:MAG: HdeD family acid-resistance protein [Gammaproteobacteria bacterium]